MGSEEIRKRLFEMQDAKYRLFQCRLMPTVSPEKVIGVRMPALRAYAAELARVGKGEAFMACLPHVYYEEDNLHAFLIERIRDYDACIAAINAFLPHVDNWATCDSLRPKSLGKHREKLIGEIQRWLESPHVYVVRFGLGMLMCWFLDGDFRQEYLELAAGVRSEEYYIRMMTAWFFATALAKQWDAALPYIEGLRLEPWTHNKAIQKAIESLRVPKERKAVLRGLKIGEKA